LDEEFILETPLMYLSKSEAWKKAEELGGKRLIDIIIEDSHSCYKGYRNNRYEWGYGCNSCPACDLRAKGWLSYTA
jgi:7-cyano-7-deazaguanine synthase